MPLFVIYNSVSMVFNGFHRHTMLYSEVWNVGLMVLAVHTVKMLWFFFFSVLTIISSASSFVFHLFNNFWWYMVSFEPLYSFESFISCHTSVSIFEMVPCQIAIEVAENVTYLLSFPSTNALTLLSCIGSTYILLL